MTTTLQRQTTRRLVGSAVVVGMMSVSAWIALVVGAVFAGFAVTGQLDIEAPVRIGPDAPAREELILPCVQGWSIDGLSGCEPSVSADVWPGGAPLPVRYAGELVAGSQDVATVPALLATAALWGTPLAAGVVVLLLVPVLRSTASGRLFEPGNARRLAVAAGAVTAAWAFVSTAPALAATAVLRALEASPLTSTGLDTFYLPTRWLVPDLRVTWWPLLVAVLLIVLAAATRSGTRLAADNEGLV